MAKFQHNFLILPPIQIWRRPCTVMPNTYPLCLEIIIIIGRNNFDCDECKNHTCNTRIYRNAHCLTAFSKHFLISYLFRDMFSSRICIGKEVLIYKNSLWVLDKLHFESSRIYKTRWYLVIDSENPICDNGDGGLDGKYKLFPIRFLLALDPHVKFKWIVCAYCDAHFSISVPKTEL